ncbi:MAG: DUF3566 domain-containing protein [Actinomycetota bacterium]
MPTLVKRIGAWSVFKFSVVAYLIFFLIFFIFVVLGYLVVLSTGMLGAEGREALETLQALGVSGGIALVVFFFVGIFFCILNTIFNAVIALIYNLIAMITGGIELSLEEKTKSEEVRK